MAVKVRAIPEEYHSVTPYLIVQGASRALDFYKKAFGAEEIMRFQDKDGKIGHAEIQIGDSRIMIADDYPEVGARGPRSLGGSPVSLLLYVENVDSRFRQAVAAGAKTLRPVKDQFYGDRSGQLEDPFGHVWTISTHTEDLSKEEMDRRAAKELAE